jgi:hypothetical protein
LSSFRFGADGYTSLVCRLTLQATTTRALTSRRGDLQLCLAAYGGGDASLVDSQQDRSSDPVWQLRRGIPYPSTLPQTAGVSLKPSSALQQLLELEAGANGGEGDRDDDADGGGDGSGGDSGSEEADAAAAEHGRLAFPPAAASGVGAAGAVAPANSASAPLTPADAAAAASSTSGPSSTVISSQPLPCFYAADELNPGSSLPGVTPVAAAALDRLCAPVHAAAGHHIAAVSIVSEHALAGVCAALPQGLRPASNPATAADTASGPRSETGSKRRAKRAAASIVIDAQSVPTRILVRDPLSDALQRALMLEDAAATTQPETFRQVRWLFRSHVEGVLLLRRCLARLAASLRSAAAAPGAPQAAGAMRASSRASPAPQDTLRATAAAPGAAANAAPAVAVPLQRPEPQQPVPPQPQVVFVVNRGGVQRQGPAAGGHRIGRPQQDRDPAAAAAHGGAAALPRGAVQLPEPVQDADAEVAAAVVRAVAAGSDVSRTELDPLLLQVGAIFAAPYANSVYLCMLSPCL